MLRYFIKSTWPALGYYRPRLVVAVPSGITAVEKRVVKKPAMNASAKFTRYLSRGCVIGAGLPVAEPVGSMIVDIGAARLRLR